MPSSTSGSACAIGVAGIALSTSLTVGLVQFIKAWRLGRLDEAFPLGGLLVVSSRSLAASLVVAVPIALVSWTLPHGLGLPQALALLVGLASAGMVGYIALSRLIGLNEPWIVARTLLSLAAVVSGREPGERRPAASDHVPGLAHARGSRAPDAPADGAPAPRIGSTCRSCSSAG